MDSCSKCRSEINEETGRSVKICCDMCKKTFHNTCVTELSRTVIQMISSCKNYCWYCDMCMDTARNLMNVAATVNDLKNMVNEHAKLISEQNKVISELKSSVLKTNAKETPSISANKRRYADVINWADESVTPVSTKDSAVKRQRRLENNSVVKDKKSYDPLLIIKSKDQNSAGNMKSDIKKLINPMNDPVRNLRQTAKGNIVVHCKDHNAVEEIKKKLNDKVGSVYDIDKPKETKPVIKMVGINEHMSETEILSCLRKQNEIITNESEIDVIKVKEVKINGNKYYTAYVTCDIKTFNGIMNKGRLYVSWDVVKCYEMVNLNRCYKCCEYGHFDKECKREEYRCPKCAGNHKLAECESNTVCCINCSEFSQKQKMVLDTNHYAWSEKCPVLQRRMKRVKDKIRYEQ